MRLDRLTVRNFRAFEKRTWDFHPKFNLLVGRNGSGKTTILDAAAVAIGSWLLGVPGAEKRHIGEDDVRVTLLRSETLHREQQFPVVIDAQGQVGALRDVRWERRLAGPGGRTTYKDAGKVKRAAEHALNLLREGSKVSLPLISYYGAGRLWDLPNETRPPGKETAPRSRLSGYEFSVDPRVSFPSLLHWLRREKYVALEKKQESGAFAVVKAAIASCVEGCSGAEYSVELDRLLLRMDHRGELPHDVLSAGQAAMVAMVADLAIKAATLNPHFGKDALFNTTGVVLIDELDVHLHPRWQTHVASDLKRTFPGLQFIVSSHSPQILANTPREEVMLLDADGAATHPTTALGLNTNEVLRDVMGAENINSQAARELTGIRGLLDDAEFEDARAQISTLRTRYGNLPELDALEVYMTRMEALADQEA